MDVEGFQYVPFEDHSPKERALPPSRLKPLESVPYFIINDPLITVITYRIIILWHFHSKDLPRSVVGPFLTILTCAPMRACVCASRFRHRVCLCISSVPQEALGQSPEARQLQQKSQCHFHFSLFLLYSEPPFVWTVAPLWDRIWPSSCYGWPAQGLLPVM